MVALPKFEPLRQFFDERSADLDEVQVQTDDLVRQAEEEVRTRWPWSYGDLRLNRVAAGPRTTSVGDFENDEKREARAMEQRRANEEALNTGIPVHH